MSGLSSLERLSRAFEGVARAITQRRRLAQALFLADPEVRAFAERVCERRGETAFLNVVWHAWHRDELGKRTYWMAHARTVLEFHPWLFECRIGAPPARARDPEPERTLAEAYPGLAAYLPPSGRNNPVSIGLEDIESELAILTRRTRFAEDALSRSRMEVRESLLDSEDLVAGERYALMVRDRDAWRKRAEKGELAKPAPVGPRCGCQARAVFSLVSPDGRSAEVRCVTCGLLAP